MRFFTARFFRLFSPEDREEFLKQLGQFERAHWIRQSFKSEFSERLQPAYL
jgi:hypothetical protein